MNNSYSPLQQYWQRLNLWAMTTPLGVSAGLTDYSRTHRLQDLLTPQLKQSVYSSPHRIRKETLRCPDWKCWHLQTSKTLKEKWYKNNPRTARCRAQSREGTNYLLAIWCRSFLLILMLSSNSDARPQPLVNNVAESIIFYNPESITPSPLFCTVQVVNFHCAIIVFWIGLHLAKSLSMQDMIFLDGGCHWGWDNPATQSGLHSNSILDSVLRMQSEILSWPHGNRVLTLIRPAHNLNTYWCIEAVCMNEYAPEKRNLR